MTDDVSGHYPEPSKTKKLTLVLLEKNTKTFKRLESLTTGVEVSSVQEARMNFLLGWMFDHVLSVAQREDFELAWQIDLERQLQVIEGKVRDAGIANTVKLATPGTPRLIVPGNLRRKGR